MVFQLIKNSSGSKSSILNEETKVNHQPPHQQSFGQQFHHPHHQHQQTSAPPSLHHSQHQNHQQLLQAQHQNNHPQMFVQQPGYPQQPQEQPPHSAQFNHHQNYNQYPSQSHPLPAPQQQPYGYYPPLPPQQQQHLQQPQDQQQQQHQQHPHSTPYPQHPPALLLSHTNPGVVQLGQHQHQQSQSHYRPPLSLLTGSRTTSYFDQNGTISLPPLNGNGGDLEQNQLQRSRNRDTTKRHTIHGSDLSLLSKFRVEDGLKSSSFNKFASDLLAFSQISSSSSQQQSSSSPPSQPSLQPQSSKQQFSPHIVHNQQPIYHTQPIHPGLHISQQQPAAPSRQQQSNSTTQQQSPSTAPAAPVKQPKKYTCHCKRSFTTSGHLARHMRIHTGEKNYECPYDGCSARFSRQDNCMQHYRTHLGGRSRGSSASNSTNNSTNNLSNNGRNSTGNRSRKSSSATLQNPANSKG